MRTHPSSLNPFSLMMEPERVIQAMERSQTLRTLRRRQLHPLDKPLIPYAKNPYAEIDAALDREPGARANPDTLND